MKPKNFPARKLARQVAADTRNLEWGAGCTAGEVYLFDQEQIPQARDVRTKKRRTNT